MYKVCPKCGKKTEKKFCSNCGTETTERELNIWIVIEKETGDDIVLTSRGLLSLEEFFDVARKKGLL